MDKEINRQQWLFEHTPAHSDNQTGYYNCLKEVISEIIIVKTRISRLYLKCV